MHILKNSCHNLTITLFSADSVHFHQLLPTVSTVPLSLVCSDGSLFHEWLQNGASTPLHYAWTCPNCIEKHLLFPNFVAQWAHSVEMFTILEISRTFNSQSSLTEHRIFFIISRFVICVRTTKLKLLHPPFDCCYDFTFYWLCPITQCDLKITELLI